jgi:hypothetical protein
MINTSNNTFTNDSVKIESYTNRKKQLIATNVSKIKNAKIAGQIFDIIYDEKIGFSENKNGIFVVAKLSDKTYKDIENIIDEYKKNDTILSSEYIPYYNEGNNIGIIETKYQYSTCEKNVLKKSEYEKFINDSDKDNLSEFNLNYTDSDKN